MKVLRGITLLFWATVMTVCVSLVAIYYILSQTVLNPSAAKQWLNESGTYSSLTEAIVPQLAAGDSSAETSFVTTAMVQRAAKASIKPETVRAKAEPIIDATYAWLDSKSPDITFSIPISAETDAFFAALQKEVLAKVKTLPECTQFVAIEEIASAGCLPWYVTAEDATNTAMQDIRRQGSLSDKVLTQDSFKAEGAKGAPSSLPDLVSYLWVAQLVAIPVFALAALFVIAKRRATGLAAVSSSLLSPGIALIVIALLLQTKGPQAIESFVSQSAVASVASSLGKTVALAVSTVSMQTGLTLVLVGLLLGIVSFFWRRRGKKVTRPSSSHGSVDTYQ